jgi:hypothetical protein
MCMGEYWLRIRRTFGLVAGRMRLCPLGLLASHALFAVVGHRHCGARAGQKSLEEKRDGLVEAEPVHVPLHMPHT